VERLDLGEQVRAHPAQHVVVGCDEHQLVVLTFRPQRLDPGIELLGRQLLLQFSGERRPERIHGQESGGKFGSEKRGRAITNFTWNLRGYPQP